MLRRLAIAVAAVFLTTLVSVPGLVAAADGVARAARSALFAAVSASSSVDPGSDGRLTVLLLGSDQRPGLSGERIDVIVVASHDPASNRVAFASIPRDTISFPRHPDNRVGGLGKSSGGARVNTMFATYQANSTACPQNTAVQRRDCALDRFKKDVAFALKLQVDYWAYLKFTAFDALIDEIGGVTVDAPGKIVDKSYMDEPTLPKGIWFEDDPTLVLHGLDTPNCLSWKSTSPECHRAIVYVRSRKGVEGSHANNDYRRSARQQRVVVGAVDVVTTKGFDLEGLRVEIQAQMAAGNRPFATNMPHTAADMAAVASMLYGATLGPNVVFKPTKYATASGSIIKLKLAAVRAWVDARMPAVP